MREKLLEFIRQYPRCSFSEMERFFGQEGYAYKGDYSIGLEKYKNLSFWYGWSWEATGLIGELYDSDAIVLLPAHQLELLTFGKLFRYPIAKQCRSYKKEHWLPMVISVSDSKGKSVAARQTTPLHLHKGHAHQRHTAL